MEGKRKGADCFRCRHFYVTWDKKFPRGCKAMGFKGKQLPCRVVLEASGNRCLKFEEKVTKPDPDQEKE